MAEMDPPGTRVKPIEEWFRILDHDLTLVVRHAPDKVRSLWLNNLLSRVIASLVGASDIGSVAIKATQKGALCVWQGLGREHETYGGTGSDSAVLLIDDLPGAPYDGARILVCDHWLLVRLSNDGTYGGSLLALSPGESHMIYQQFRYLWVKNMYSGLNARFRVEIWKR